MTLLFGKTWASLKDLGFPYTDKRAFHMMRTSHHIHIITWIGNTGLRDTGDGFAEFHIPINSDVGQHKSLVFEYISLIDQSFQNFDYYTMEIRIRKAFERFITVKHGLTCEILEENLSHGSGIDGIWFVDDMGKYFRCRNGYHCMNDCGMYDGWANFSLYIPKKDPVLGFTLHFNGKESQYKNQKYMLKEYLEDTFCGDLQTILKKTATAKEK
jgi:hypothetical protein